MFSQVKEKGDYSFNLPIKCQIGLYLDTGTPELKFQQWKFLKSVLTVQLFITWKWSCLQWNKSGSKLLDNKLGMLRVSSDSLWVCLR